MCWDIDRGNPCMQEEPRQPPRKGATSTTMGHNRLQGRARRERTLVASRIQKLTRRIRTSGISDGHHRQDSGGRLK